MTLTAGELSSMRDTLEDSLAGTAVVKVSSWVSDGGGGGTTTWTPSGTVSCRVAPAGGGETTDGSRLQPDTQVIFTIPQDTTIDPDAVIEYESRVYSVTALRAPRTWEISRRVEAKEVE